MTVRITKPEFNLREKLSELDKPSGLKGNELMRAETTQDARDLIGTSRRNLIINGDFQVSQRGNYTSSAVTAGHDTYWLDRWMSLKSGTTSTVQRVTRTVNGVSQYAARIVCTVAGNGIMGFNQRVELTNIPIGRTLTASAMVRTNHPYVGFRTNTFQNSGGDRGVKAIPDGNWHRIYWTFDSTGTINASGGDILIVAYNNAAVSIAVGDFIEIAEVQLEVGKVATEFDHRSFAEEYELCQRYFQSNFPVGVPPQNGYYSSTSKLAAGFNGVVCFNGSQARAPWVMFHPKMRTTPTVTLYSASSDDTDSKWAAYKGAWNSGSTMQIDYFESNGFGVRYNSGGHSFIVGEAYLYRGMWKAEAEL